MAIPQDLANESILLQYLQTLISTYQSQKSSPTTHIAEFFFSHRLDPNDNDSIFLKQVFYGLIRHEKSLKVLSDLLFFLRSGQTVRSDAALFHIIIYLCLFRLKEMGYDIFRRFVFTQDPNKMYVLLSFLFDSDLLSTKIKEQLSTVYDCTYVEDTIITDLKTFSFDMQELIGLLAEKSSTVLAESNKNVPLNQNADDSNLTEQLPNYTIPKPFNFKNRPPRVGLPPPNVIIPRTISINHVPNTLYHTSLDQINQYKEERKQKLHEETMEKFLQAKGPNDNKENQLRMERSVQRLEKVKKEVEEERKKAMQSTYVYHPPPDFSAIQAPPVKLNTTSLLREEARIKQEQSQMAAELRSFEHSLVDNTQYSNWVKEQKEKDDQEKKNLIEARREELLNAAKDALLSVERNVEQKKKEALLAKEQTNLLKQQLLEEETKRELLNRKKVEAISKDSKEKRQQVIQQVLENKKKIAQEIDQESRDLAQKMKILAEKEIQEKREIIIKIQTQEKLSNARAQTHHREDFDPTTTGQSGLLEEMSLVELKARLEMLQQDQLKEVQEKKCRIIKDKQKKQQKLQQVSMNILKHRQEQQKKNSKTSSSSFSSQTPSNSTTSSEEKALKWYNQKLQQQEKKQQQAIHLAQELKSTKDQQLFKQNNKQKIQQQTLMDLNSNDEKVTLKRSQDLQKQYQRNQLIQAQKTNDLQTYQKNIFSQKLKDSIQQKKQFEVLQKEVQDNLSKTQIQKIQKTQKLHEEEKNRFYQQKAKYKYSNEISSQQIKQARDFAKKQKEKEMKKDSKLKTN